MARRKYFRRNPYRRRFKRRNYRFSSRRRSGFRRWRVARQKNLVFSNSQLVTLRYCKNIQLNPANGATISVATFRANDIYFCDGLAGSEPKGTTEWEGFYNHYLVIGSKMTAMFNSGSSTTSNGAGTVGVVLTDTSNVAYINNTDVMTEPRARWKIIGNQTGTGTKTITKGYSPKKFFTIHNLLDNQEHYGAPVSVSPPEIAFFQVFFAPHAASAGTGGPWVTVIIDYKVMYTGPKRIAPS
ncbi:putative capsid protein [Odonata-associated circular virus-9]|uniref:putative capsid protein n=1 Tax=Odonata-associated circular virus-9 TaxID=1592129 RepID=UPI0005860F89|nr:putative capsid protein [Odonata-associated circular virus-9]AJD07475.1 putative capsid protein [Odonata-associated circular virus-9]